VFEALLARLAGALDRAAIPYMVIGGQAVQLYGEPRMTRDIDLTLGLGVDGLPRVLALCLETGLKVLVSDEEKFVRDTMVLPALEEKSGIRVDFVFSFSEYEQLALERARTERLKGHPVRFASLEDLVVHKVVAGRARDLEDVYAILVKNPGFDREYIEQWLVELYKALSTGPLGVFQRLVREIEQAGAHS
jgi:hypothetical protein